MAAQDVTPTPQEIARVTGGDPEKIRSGMHAFEFEDAEKSDEE